MSLFIKICTCFSLYKKALICPGNILLSHPSPFFVCTHSTLRARYDLLFFILVKQIQNIYFLVCCSSFKAEQPLAKYIHSSFIFIWTYNILLTTWFFTLLHDKWLHLLTLCFTTEWYSYPCPCTSFLDTMVPL
jgi:hypothetical protein